MKKLVILTGGNSLEKHISLKSCENILKYFNKDKYIINVINIPEDFNKNIQWIKEIMEISPDIVFSTLHGGAGEDGTMQGLLDMLSIKYVGSRTLSSGLCADKKLSKDIMSFNKIPILQDIFIEKDEEIFKYENEIKELGFPLIVKPNKAGASIGLHLVYNLEQLEKAINYIKSLNDDILIEKYIDGQEVTCCVIERESGLFVLPLLDINVKDKIFDYSAKYNEDGNVNFSLLPNFLQKMIKEISKKVFTILKCEGYANIDLIIKEEEIYVLEVNTIPGFTEKSLLPKAINIMGISISQFLDEMIQYRLNKR